MNPHCLSTCTCVVQSCWKCQRMSGCDVAMTASNLFAVFVFILSEIMWLCLWFTAGGVKRSAGHYSSHCVWRHPRSGENQLVSPLLKLLTIVTHWDFFFFFFLWFDYYFLLLFSMANLTFDQWTIIVKEPL